MAKIYLRKITNKELNTNTGQEWTIEDVPQRWRAEVEELLNVAES